MPLPSPCIECDRITKNGTRCPECDSGKKRREWQRRNRERPNRHKQGLGAEHEKLRRQAIQRQPWCSRCGTRGSRENPLTGDHIVPRSAGGRNELANYDVLCRACNGQKAAQNPQ